MKKIKVGIFGPGGRMGSDLLEQIENFKVETPIDVVNLPIKTLKSCMFPFL